MSQRWIRAALVVLNLVLILVILGTWGYAWRLDRRVDKALAEPKPPAAKKVEKPAESPSSTADMATTDSVNAATADTATTDSVTTATADAATTDSVTTATADAATTATSVTVATRVDPAVAPPQMRPEDTGRQERRDERRSRKGKGLHRPGVPSGVPGGAPVTNTGGLSDELAGLLKSKALFGKQPPPPPAVIQGVIGDQVLINNQWLAVGGSAGSIKLLEIRGDIVVVEVNGVRQENKVWQEMPNPTPPPGQRPPQGMVSPIPAPNAAVLEQVSPMGEKFRKKWSQARGAAGQFLRSRGLRRNRPPAENAPPDASSAAETDASPN